VVFAAPDGRDLQWPAIKSPSRSTGRKLSLRESIGSSNGGRGIQKTSSFCCFLVCSETPVLFDKRVFCKWAAIVTFLSLFLGSCATAPTIVYQAPPTDPAWKGLASVTVAPVFDRTESAAAHDATFRHALGRELMEWNRSISVDGSPPPDWLLPASQAAFQEGDMPADLKARLSKEFPGSALALICVDAIESREETDHEYEQTRQPDGSYRSTFVLSRYRTETVSGRLKLIAAGSGNPLLELAYVSRTRRKTGNSGQSFAYSVGAAVGSSFASTNLVRPMLNAFATAVAKASRSARPEPGVTFN